MCLHVHCHSRPAADGRGRERQREPTSTLEVPEQQRMPTHHIRSRSVSPHREEQGRIRSRPPNVPTQRWGLMDETRVWFKGKQKMPDMKCYETSSSLMKNWTRDIKWYTETLHCKLKKGCKTFINLRFMDSGGYGQLYSSCNEFQCWHIFAYVFHFLAAHCIFSMLQMVIFYPKYGLIHCFGLSGAHSLDSVRT